MREGLENGIFRNKFIYKIIISCSLLKTYEEFLIENNMTMHSFLCTSYSVFVYSVSGLVCLLDYSITIIHD